MTKGHDLDPRFLSENTKDMIAKAKQELEENPITYWDLVKSWLKVTIWYPVYIGFLKFSLVVKKIFLF